ncbi:MAG: prolyl oligopeptidase family serine peptidase [Planctomycetota bacterium]|jgi:dipeptidyl aminopeptidase/acylaminoacyl peptidase
MKTLLSVLLLVSVALMTAASPAQSPRAMKVDDLFQIRRIADPQISPDGKQVVFVVTTVNLEGNSTSSNLWLADVARPETARQLTTTPKKDLNPRWSPDGKRILFQSTRSGSMQLWVIDLSGGEARQLTSISTEAATGVWAPNGKSIAFVSAIWPEYSHKPFAESDKLNKDRAEANEKNPVKAKVFDRLFFRHWDSYVENKRQHLFVISFDPAEGTAGEPKDVTPGDRDAYPTSMTFSVGDDFCFSPDSSHLIFTAVPVENEAWNTNHDLCRVPVTGGTPTWDALTKNGAADGAPAFSPDGKWLAWRAQAVPGSEADRWVAWIAPCEPSGKLTSEPRALTADLDRSVEGIHWTKTGADQLVVFSAEDGGVSKIFTVAADGKSPVRLTNPQAPVDSVSIGGLSISPSTGRFAVLASRLDSPPGVFVGEQTSEMGRLVPVGSFNKQLQSDIAWGKIESVTVPGAGGTPMQMWLVYPPGFDPAKKWPLAFLVHGGPQGAWMNSWSNRWNPQVWAAQGYVVALPNPRGSTGFGQKYTDEISGDWGGKCYEDLMKGLEWLETKPFVDRDRMFAAGASFGGYMMNWFQGQTDKFKTLVTHCGVYNFDSMYATTEEVWFDEWEHGGPPWVNRDSYEKYSPHRFAQNFKTPMLIIHNDLDFRVPVSEGLQLFTTLQRLGVPSKLINFPDEGHWVNKPANSKFWHDEIFAWLRNYCPPGAK